MQNLEQELVEGCIVGDRRIQQKLYNAYASKMLVLCNRYCRTSAEAEDILQEAFIKIFSKINTFRFECPLSAWIRTIVVNTAINHIRKEKDLQFSVDLDQAFGVENNMASAISELSFNELLSLVRSLPLGCQTVFNLYAIDGFDHKEIGEKLGISVGTSKSQYARAKGLLQKKLENLSFNHAATKRR
ncbi:MAG: RNA polymerase sigma factor [Bacteroidota bacterium]